MAADLHDEDAFPIFRIPPSCLMLTLHNHSFQRVGSDTDCNV